MPNLLIFDSSVRRGILSLAAAPEGPETRPWHSANAALIISTSRCAKTQSTTRKFLLWKVVARRMYPLLAALTLFAVSPLSAQSPAEGVADAPPRATEPVADPAAVVKAGHARFTVLTPKLVRMEWADDDKFEDHPSLVFLNRRLPVPQFTRKLSDNTVTIDTGKLQLVYRRTGKSAGFTAAILAITLQPCR
jgi:hypothetical protein